MKFKLSRKDLFILVVATLWILSNAVAYIVQGMDFVTASNIIWIVALIAASSSSKFMSWLNGGNRR